MDRHYLRRGAKMTVLMTKNSKAYVAPFFFVFFLMGMIFAGHNAVAGDDTFDIVKEKLMEDPADSNSVAAASTVDASSAYLAVDKGVAQGGSLDSTNSSQLHEFEIHGRSASNNGEAIITIGYKKRY